MSFCLIHMVLCIRAFNITLKHTFLAKAIKRFTQQKYGAIKERQPYESYRHEQEDGLAAGREWINYRRQRPHRGKIYQPSIEDLLARNCEATVKSRQNLPLSFPTPC